MYNFRTLLAGELQRMLKYHILTASVLVAFFWIGALHLLETGDISYFFSLIVFFDVVSMSIVMVGVTIFFEKQEGVLQSIFVSPISKDEFISAKTTGNLLQNLITILIVYFYALLFQNININLAGLLGAILLIGLFHSLVGFLIIYYCRDFTELLVNMAAYFLIFTIPIILEFMGVLGTLATNLLYLLPTKASAVLMEGVIGQAQTRELMLSVFYLIIGSLILGYFVRRKFKIFAARESGV